MIRYISPADVLRLQENDVEADYDGGRVVLVADQNLVMNDDQKISQLTVVINYRRDDPMRAWPTNRQERAARRFSLLVLESATEEDLAAIADLLKKRKKGK